MLNKRIFFSASDRISQSGADQLIRISSSDSHHLRNVLRLEEGAELCAIDRDSGIAYQAFIVKLAERVTLSLGNEQQLKGANATSAVGCLLFALGKSGVNELVAEKATELGVSSVLFWQAERSVLRLKGAAEIQKKRERFQRIAEGAARQCARITVPAVEVLPALPELLDHFNGSTNPEDLRLFGGLSQNALSLRKIVRSDLTAHLLIGPAGDLTAGEQQILVEQGFIPVSFGHLVLRSETAAIAGIAMLSALWEACKLNEVS